MQNKFNDAMDLECQTASPKFFDTLDIRNLYHAALSLRSEILSLQDSYQASYPPGPNDLTTACAERMVPANL